jgi:hypothetical protein
MHTTDCQKVHGTSPNITGKSAAIRTSTLDMLDTAYINCLNSASMDNCGHIPVSGRNKHTLPGAAYATGRNASAPTHVRRAILRPAAVQHNTEEHQDF